MRKKASRKSKLTVGSDSIGSSASDSRRTGELKSSTFLNTSRRTFQFKALVFDYSGLLINDLFFTLEIVNKVFKQFNLPAISLQEFQRAFRLPFYSIFTDKGIPQRTAIQSSLKIYRANYSAYKNAISPFDDAVICIKSLAKLGIDLAIVSQTPRPQLAYQLDRCGLLGYFSSILALGESPREKPDPLPLLETARRLGVMPEEMIFVGDMNEDLECARRASTSSVAVDRLGSYHDRNRLLQAKPDFIIPSLLELTRLLTAKRMEVAA